MVKIISDSTCDLSPELLKKYDIEILPLQIILGDTNHSDTVDITPDEIYRWSDQTKQSPKTAALNVWQIYERLLPYEKETQEVVLFSISESMSSTLSNMRSAVQMLDHPERMHVIDSANLSTGIGLLVIEAAIMAKQGCTAAEIIERIEALKPHVRASFVVDTLTYLRRGGRCSGIEALAGSMLQLHPKIIVQDGKMTVSKKYRGSIQKAIAAYVSDLQPQLEKSKKNRVFITHSGCSDEILSQVNDQLESMHHFDEILVTRAGGVISSHCGPSTLGVLFIEEPEDPRT